MSNGRQQFRRNERPSEKCARKSAPRETQERTARRVAILVCTVHAKRKMQRINNSLRESGEKYTEVQPKYGKRKARRKVCASTLERVRRTRRKTKAFVQLPDSAHIDIHRRTVFRLGYISHRLPLSLQTPANGKKRTRLARSPF